MDKSPLHNKYAQQDDKFLNALAEAYRLQEAIISATNLSIISTSPDGIITSFNKAAEILLGYKAEEAIGKLTPDLFHDKKEIAQRAQEFSQELGIPVTPDFETLVARVRNNNMADCREWTYIRKNGSRVPVLLSVTALMDGRHQLIGYATIATDISEQKMAEAKIKESEAQLRTLISSLDDIVFELDDQGRFNNIWVKDDSFLFLPRDQMYGRTLTQMFGELFAKPFEEGLKRVLQTGESFHHEYKTLVPGDERWFNAKYSLIFDNGVPTRRVSVCVQDITARKKVEISLRASEEKFRLLAQNVQGVIYLCNNDNIYSMIYLNDHVEEVTGYTANDFISGQVNFVDLFHKDDRAHIHETVQRALANHTSFHLEYRLHHKSGRWRWVEDTGIGVYGDNRLLMLEGFIIDITARKEAEEELRKISDENYRVFNNTINLTAVASFDGYFKKLNPAWKKTLGWTLEELTSQKIESFIHPDDLEKTREAAGSVRAGNNLSIFENRYRCKDGSYRWLLWSSSPDVNQQLAYASAIDITERKKSEEELLLSKRNLEIAAIELQEQNRQLDEFAHIISHNLRSPVGNITALINFINEKSTPEEYKLIFEKIRNVTTNLNETMNELMETLRVKKNTEIERSEIRFKDILDKVVQSLEGELIQCGATVTFDFNDAPKISYSKPYLESIFQNLLSNAIKYRSPSRLPQIHITTEAIDHTVELRFRDNGLGIDMKKFSSKLFGLHKTFHENKEAKGVGLFLTKTQVEAMGGSISAESEVDKGSVFIVRF